MNSVFTQVPGELQGGLGVVSEPSRLANPDFGVPEKVSNSAANLRQGFQDFNAPFGTSKEFVTFLGKSLMSQMFGHID